MKRSGAHEPYLDRSRSIRSIRKRNCWDMIVIGGGATGLGTALDAASRDLSVLLLEQSDFCKSTSSRSTKLIHGGVRYLEQGEIGLVRSALKERSYLLNHAAHVVSEREFVLPARSWFQKMYYGMGLKGYDLLSWGDPVENSAFLSREETLDKLKTLEADRFTGGIAYRDGQFDDARLGIQVAKTVEQHGGTVVNYFPVTDLLVENGTVRGVRARDREDETSYEIRADSVINAAGIFTDSIRRMVDPDRNDLLSVSQGIHVVVDQSYLPGETALLIPETDDGRVLFAIPWHNRVLIGTTDVPVDEPKLEPIPSEDEITYLLDHASRYLSPAPERSDILSTFAGLRPLVKPESQENTSQISRDHMIEVDRSGLITITGGKWTTFREMAEDTVDRALRETDRDFRSSCSDELDIQGHTPNPPSNLAWDTYGTEAKQVQQLHKEDSKYDKPFHEELPYRRSQVIWAVRQEMARTVDDVLARRTRSLFLDARAALECAQTVAEIMAEELERDDDWIEHQINAFRSLAANYLPESVNFTTE